MPYEYNLLLKYNFQKKSEVTPSDISRLEGEISDVQTSVSDLQQKKVTKFFSANDTLENNEIAEYQGENDTTNDLVKGYFYKKNPPYSVIYDTTEEKTLPFRELFIYDFEGQVVEIQKYIANRLINFKNLFGTVNNIPVNLLLVDTSFFDVQGFYKIDATTYAAPYIITLDNNNIVAKKAVITYVNNNYYVDGILFSYSSSGNTENSYITIHEGLFYFWHASHLEGRRFCFPFLIQNSNYSTANLIGLAEIPTLFQYFVLEYNQGNVNYYDYSVTLSNSLFTRIDTQPQTVIDSELSATSTNPVQNAVISNALATKITNAGKSAQASTDAKSIYVITQAEYNALTTIVPDQLYFII